MLDHRYLINRLSIEGALVTLSPLRIGGSREESPFQIADLGLIRIFRRGKVIPYIPGSSLKGVLRSTVEKIYKSFNLQNICEITNPKNSCGGRFRNQLNAAMKDKDKKRANQMLLNIVEKQFCDICKIFGSSGYKSNIYIDDAYPLTETSFKIEKRPGIGIDRIKGFISRRALYSTEYLATGSKFHFSMRLENLTPPLMRWIFLAIDFLNTQRAFIGSFSTKGFGRVEVIFHNVQYTPFTEIAPKLQIPQVQDKKFQDFTKAVISYFKSMNGGE
ncbi:MAG: type III CRISPR-associated RAMP protein Csx7 [Candidatus Helarchaeota archaeon]